MEDKKVTFSDLFDAINRVMDTLPDGNKIVELEAKENPDSMELYRLEVLRRYDNMLNIYDSVQATHLSGIFRPNMIQNRKWNAFIFRDEHPDAKLYYRKHEEL